jgi:hypothetical protein
MTALLDVNGNTVLRALLPAAAATVTANGASVDVRDLSGVAAIVLDSAAGTGTTPTLAIAIQDSPDGTTGWAAIPGATFTQVAGTASLQKIGVNVNACRGFLRAVETVGGTTPSFVRSVTLLSRPEL